MAGPACAGLLAEVLARLWHLTGETRWRARAEDLFRAFSGAPEGIGGSPLLLLAADLLERGGCVVIDGRLDDPAAAALANAALGAADPGLTVFRLDGRLWPHGAPRHGALERGSPVAMLCRDQTCSLPVASPEALSDLIRTTLQSPGGRNQEHSV